VDRASIRVVAADAGFNCDIDASVRGIGVLVPLEGRGSPSAARRREGCTFRDRVAMRRRRCAGGSSDGARWG